MEVLVTVRNRSHSYGNVTRAELVVDVNPEKSVGELVELISDRLRVPLSCLQVILAGKVLSHSTTLRSLQLGPQTSLAALVVDADLSSPTEGTAGVSGKAKGPEREGNPEGTPRETAASFRVFCKNCDSVERGKLRVYCEECGSSSIIVKSDPSRWDDVLSLHSIRAECKECDKETFALFRFKCVKCAEIAIPLTQMRGAGVESCCSVCGDKSLETTVDLGCGHQTCIDCFTIYMKTAFKDQRFVLRPPHGYTLRCPVYECQACVSDPHHFHLLGKQGYDEYQKQGTEKYVSLQRGGLFCPNPSCGDGFILEPEIEFFRATCPECGKVFCTVCRQEKCTCGEDADATRETIRATCRPCPRCGVETERSGGCAHIHCQQCHADWCFICVKLWTVDCQWDHWFA